MAEMEGGRVHVLLFASLADAAGWQSQTLPIPPEATLEALSRTLCAHYPGLQARLHLARVAVNETLVDGDTPLKSGDEVAYLPAVSGGAPEHVWVRIVDEPISLDEVVNMVRRADCGAVVLFLGTVRDHFRGRKVLGLEYESHRALAERMLGDVAAEAMQRGAHAVALVHRLGAMDVGEVSVAVAVASPHRPEAFAAGKYAIDRLKVFVPIWKKELFEDGSVWVEGEDRVVSSPPDGARVRTPVASSPNVQIATISHVEDVCS